ncbi:hypothetical protein CTI12_AA628780 [Artemisia annua]|uniref:Reverse transcriptase zinc-binding domain-containing protein n=1 Tax=Artemisia annua TaxID=35608 RepID=A0A2U1K9I7_ARTAN|nr:hypothetical protein CTI12_AA628780 [Artemisia annua]
MEMREACRRKLIDAKYRSNESNLSSSSPRKYSVSPVWKKISSLVHLQSSSGDIARKGLIHCVGRGNKPRFWEDHWVEGYILKVSFLRMFALAIHKSGLVCNFGFWEDRQWNWDVKFRRRLFDWNMDQFEAFSSLLNSMMLVASNDDKVIWSFDSLGKFSPKSFSYEVENMNYHGNPLLSSIWKIKVPSKARLLCWQVLSSNLPTRDLLSRIGVISEDHIECPVCNSNMESIDHFLFIAKFGLLFGGR